MRRVQDLVYTFDEDVLGRWRVCVSMDSPIAEELGLAFRGMAVVQTTSPTTKFHVCQIGLDGHLVTTQRVETLLEAVRMMKVDFSAPIEKSLSKANKYDA